MSSATLTAPGSVNAATKTAPVRWGVPLAVLIAGMFMSVLDTSIVNVAVSTIQTDFGGSAADVEWIATAYTLVLGVVVPASGWLGDRFGLARVYTVALAAFALGSALCGLAWNLDSLIAFRIIQAIPGGVLPAVTLTMVYRIVPRERIGAAMGMYGLGIVFAPALGPALGGYLVEYLNWRLVFYINVPIGVLGVIAAIIALPSFPAQRSQRFDVLGFITAAAGMVALLLAFSQGQEWGWTSYRVLLLIIGGLLSIALFVVIELEVEHPLLDLRVFRSRPYTVSLIVMAVMMSGLFATLFYIPFFLQAGLGFRAFETGLLILPQALVMAVLTPISGRLYDKVGPRWLVVSGLVVAAFGSYLLAGVNPNVTKHQIILWTCIRSAGVGMSMMSVMTGGISSLDRHLTTSGSAINTVAQRVSAALGLAGLTALATTQQAQLTAGRAILLTTSDPATAHIGFRSLYALYRRTNVDVLANSYSNIFLLTAGINLLAIIPALFLRSGRAVHSDGPAPVVAD
jgi:EmrB/QacA subfamily drug resistance transporter